MSKSKTIESHVEILKLSTETTRFHIVGTRPMILHRMSQKAMQTLLSPAGKKTAVEKASSLKHDPLKEFEESIYRNNDEKGETLIQQLASCFRNAMAGAALDIAGAKKSEIGRRLWISADRISIYGIPKLFMAITRSSDINRTPDVRTRCIIPEWAAVVDVTYTVPALRHQEVANLLATAGLTQGIGDWRPQKGKGSYGQFEIVEKNDPRFLHISKLGRKAQIAAMKNPDCYDDETESLLSWYKVESRRRGFKEVVNG